MAHGKSPKHTRKAKTDQAGSSARAGRSAGASSRSKSAVAKTSAASKTRSDSAPLHARPKRPAAEEFDAAVRLQKLLAGAGFGSRREVEQYLIDERVTVNGKTAALGDRANPSVDDIRFDGERVLRDRPAYWIVNKPRAIVTTVRDEDGRRTVMDLLPEKVGRLFPVGRLDKETTGLLLLTNDGDAAYALLHPSLGNEREYRVNVKGQIDAKAVKRLERGVQLEDGRTSPAAVSDISYDSTNGTSNLSLTLGEGRKRQIRRSLLILGFPVRRLVRVRMGPLRLGRLPVGEARPLRSEEKRALLQHVAWLKGEADAPPALSTKATPSTPSKRARKGPPETAAPSLPRKKAIRKKTSARRGVDRNKPDRKKKAGKGGAGRKKKAGAKSGRASGGASGGTRGGPRGGQRTASSRKGPRT